MWVYRCEHPQGRVSSHMRETHLTPNVLVARAACFACSTSASSPCSAGPRRGDVIGRPVQDTVRGSVRHDNVSGHGHTRPRRLGAWSPPGVSVRHGPPCLRLPWLRCPAIHAQCHRFSCVAPYPRITQRDTSDTHQPAAHKPRAHRDRAPSYNSSVTAIYS